MWGVGYEVDAPLSTFYGLPDLGEEVTLYTHLAIREDAHHLFGFASEAERALFRTLIKVSGVGAKLALTILSGLSAAEFQRCVEAQDTARLVRLPGSGSAPRNASSSSCATGCRKRPGRGGRRRTPTR